MKTYTQYLRNPSPIPERRTKSTKVYIRNTDPMVQVPRRRKLHPLFYIGTGLCLGLVLLAGGINISAWLQGIQDDYTYGHLRASGVDRTVGVGDDLNHPSHFILYNLEGNIYCLDQPGLHPDHPTLFHVAYIDGGKDLITTLSFVDVNGDGRVDLVFDVGGKYSITYINSGLGFQSK